MKTSLRRTADIFVKEFLSIFKDQGALLFCIILPLAYPIIYSWVYNNEVVRDVPVAVVDNSHSSLSREFIQKVDASPDVSVSMYCGSIDEAKSQVGHGNVYGVIYFPADFAVNVGRMQQTHVSVYCDMSYMLTYKAIFQTCTSVSQMMGSDITTKLSGAYTSRDAEISSRPLDFEEVPIFNTTGGYGNFIIPAVLVLIIQQAMLLAVGMLTGTDRERGWASVDGILSTFFGKGGAYFVVFFVMLAYVCLAVPRMFGFVSMLHFFDWLMFAIPYLFAVVCFCIALSSMVRYRESVILLVVFTSIPMLFLSGISWPQSNVPGFWAAIADLIPSTFGIRGYVRMNSMGARLSDIYPEIIALWAHALVYGLLSIFVIYRRNKMKLAKND